MSQFYKILKADPLGDPWESHGKSIQTWWCQVEDVDKDVSIGKQVGNNLRAGQHVYGDLMYAKSQKGNEYWKFKSAQVPEGVPRPADSPQQATAQAAVGEVGGQVPGWAVPLYNMVEYIYKEMKKMESPADDAPAPAPAKAVEQIGGDPIDPETKATLDDIFGKSEEPETKVDDAPEPEGK